MRKRWVAAAAVGLATACAATAAAAGPEKTVFGEARSGDLRVISSAIMLPRAAEMRGGWLNDAVPCTDTRTLDVTVQIIWSKGQQTKSKTRAKSMTVDNCAEGGPNVGFTLNAKANGFGCPNGTWRPGDYSFSTTTVEQASGLTAHAVLILTKTAKC
jgi:hypothetical protein